MITTCFLALIQRSEIVGCGTASAVNDLFAFAGVVIVMESSHICETLGSTIFASVGQIANASCEIFIANVICHTKNYSKTHHHRLEHKPRTSAKRQRKLLRISSYLWLITNCNKRFVRLVWLIYQMRVQKKNQNRSKSDCLIRMVSTIFELRIQPISR